MVFVLSLLFFIAIRWQPEPWLRTQIEEQSMQSGFTLHYEHMETEGFTARLDQVSVHAKGLAVPLKFDFLTLKPAWASLLSGTYGIQLQMNWQGQQGVAILNWQDDYIDIHDIGAELDVSVLQMLWHKYMSLPVHVIGHVRVSGNVRLDMRSGRPVQGKLDAGWRSAAIKMADGNIPLGDYQLAMMVDETSTSWRWTLGGGKAVLLQSEGRIGIPLNIRQAWPVSGQARIEVGKEAGVLSAMLSTSPLVFNLSGNAANPKLQRM